METLKRNIAIVCGGDSSEHDVSMRSARGLYSFFDKERYNAYIVEMKGVDWHVEPQETLRKITDNPPQSGLDDPAARRANVLNVYEAVEPAAIRGKRFLLIDDILTTGATLSECVRILREAGAADVVCLTLAMVRDK